jgi:formate hydrogenlyase transcriptional activator
MPEELQFDAEETCSVASCREPEIDNRGRRHCFYELLLKIADLSTGGHLGDVLEEIAPPVQRLTGCDLIDFSLHDSHQNSFTTRFWKTDGESGELKPRAATDSISAWVWTHQEALVIADMAGEARFPECLNELRAHGVRSYAALPITTSLRRFGVLGLGCRHPQVADSQGLEFLMRITHTAALALENRETMHAWAEQRERLQALMSMTQELNTTRNLEELLPLLLSGLRRILHHDATWVALVEEDGCARVQTIDAPSLECLHVQDRAFTLDEIPSGRAIKTGKATLLNREELRQLRGFGEAVAESGIQTLSNIPLISGGRIWGSLSLGSFQRNAFRREDTDFLLQVGNQLAAAVANAHAYREITSLKDRLAAEKSYLEKEIQAHMHGDEIVGTSAGLRRVIEASAVVARTDATVLVTGETGTGKERIARIIHAMSDRKDRSFIKLNCAAIPTGLLESELFGHEKGAFTGAVSQKVGRLELADKGTLFLDEIGDIPLELQPKLLRVLQDYEFERLGGIRTIRVNIRLIAATNRDLARAVEEKQFRRDLFYRLHVFPIHLPTLRERQEDIPLLLRHFVAKCSERLGKQIHTIPDQVIEAMKKWHWPGNIRELENFVERSVILSQDRVLRAPLGEIQFGVQNGGTVPDDTLRGREREHIIQMLRQTRGMLSGPSGAAARLGLKRTTLQYRMQKLGISRTDYLD